MNEHRISSISRYISQNFEVGSRGVNLVLKYFYLSMSNSAFEFTNVGAILLLRSSSNMLSKDFSILLLVL